MRESGAVYDALFESAPAAAVADAEIECAPYTQASADAAAFHADAAATTIEIEVIFAASRRQRMRFRHASSSDCYAMPADIYQITPVFRFQSCATIRTKNYIATNRITIHDARTRRRGDAPFMPAAVMRRSVCRLRIDRGAQRIHRDDDSVM